MRFAERLHMKLSVGEKGKQFKFFPQPTIGFLICFQFFRFIFFLVPHFV
jgi:hypothetical protein